MSANYTYPVLCGLLAKSPTKLSQAMHNAAFKKLGLEYRYIAIDTDDTEFSLKAMRKLGFRGYSLTIPHKEKAIEFVDELSDEARQISAINTVINDGQKLKGYNTDCYGISEAFKEKAISVKNKKVFLFGAGGASRAAIYSMQEGGASEILIANRSNERASALAEEFSLRPVIFEDLAKFPFSDIDIFINSTPIGSHLAGDDYPFDISVFSKGQAVFDMITGETELLKQAEKNGATPISGLRMLLFQAVKQSELFTAKKAPVQEMEGALYTFYSKL